MKILITGGSGFLGTCLAKNLLLAGHSVTIYSRRKPENIKKTVTGDILNEKRLASSLKDIDTVYHLAANLDESDPKMYKQNTETTKAVISTCKKNKIKHIIFTSSIGVLGYTKAPATENMPYNPTTKYEKSKAECEKLIKASGLPYTIARITIIYGPNKFWKQIFKAAKKNYPVIGKGNNNWHLVYIDDVVDALTLMLKDTKKNQTYHIADNKAHTYLETYKIISETIGAPEPKKHISVFLIKTMALLHETKCKILKQKPNVTKMTSSIDRLIRERTVSIDKAKKELGYNPKYDLKTGMKKTYDCLYPLISTTVNQ